MTTYIKLSELIKQNYPKEIIGKLIAEILKTTLPAKKDYPDYEKWFLEKHIPGCYQGTRDTIIAIKKGTIVGIANLKNDTEQKICTLYIKPGFRRKKEGINLVEQTFEFLNTNKPIITMPITKIKQFYSIIEKYDWNLTESIDDCYKENTTELIFNDPKKESINEPLITTLEKIIIKKKLSQIQKIITLFTPPKKVS